MPSLDLCEIITDSRNLFRKKLWTQFAEMKSRSLNNEEDGLLERVNWNLVKQTQKFFINEADVLLPAVAFHPLAIVMISVDVEQGMNANWSNSFVEKCVRGGSIYGSIGVTTLVVVQLFFSGLRKVSKESTRGSQVDDGVGIIIVDGKCNGWSYNLPTGQSGKLGVRCVENMMKVAVDKDLKEVVNMVSYSEKSQYDNNL